MINPQSKCILLTGGTGNLGAFALRKFLERGDRVTAIVRSRRNHQMAQDRVVRSMSTFGEVNTEWLPRLDVVMADITDETGMRSVQIPREIDETWHFSSSLKYMPKDRDEIYSVNIDGLKNVLALHRDNASNDGKFFYISTAYIGGKGPVRVPERRIVAAEKATFHNDYEKSKLEAESIVLDQCESDQIFGAVFRPSIVVADRGTNRLLNYNGFYLGIKVFLELRKHLERVGAEKRVRLFAKPMNELNLMPIDDLIESMLFTAGQDFHNGSIFNVVNGKGINIREVTEVVGKVLDIEIEVCGPDEEESIPKNKYEKMISYGMTYTFPYVTDEISFDTENLTEKLGEQYRFNMYPDFLSRITKAYVDFIGEEGRC